MSSLNKQSWRWQIVEFNDKSSSGSLWMKVGNNLMQENEQKHNETCDILHNNHIPKRCNTHFVQQRLLLRTNISLAHTVYRKWAQFNMAIHLTNNNNHFSRRGWLQIIFLAVSPVLLSRAMFIMASWYASSTSSCVTTSLILFHFSGWGIKIYTVSSIRVYMKRQRIIQEQVGGLTISSHWWTATATCVPSGLVNTSTSPGTALSGLKTPNRESSVFFWLKNNLII